MQSDSSPRSSNVGDRSGRELLQLVQSTLGAARRILEDPDLVVSNRMAALTGNITVLAEELVALVERRLAGEPGDDNPTPEQYRSAAGR